MFSKKQKLVTTLVLGIGLTCGLTPTFADSTNVTSLSPIKEEQVRIQIPFTGYVISTTGHYLVVANTPTKQEALFYQNNWWELVSQNKILMVPVSNVEVYALGEKLNVYTAAWTKSLPPIAITPIIEKVTE